jgi:hypothetical protein
VSPFGKNDEDFRTEVGEKPSVEERKEYVKKAGFDFTKEKLDAFVKSRK